jgi:plastocyanin
LDFENTSEAIGEWNGGEIRASEPSSVSYVSKGETQMPFNWTININPNDPQPPLAKFEPDTLAQVAPGDQVFWANNDNAAHWPGLLNPDGSINKTFFIPNQIASNSTSDAFSPAADATLNYACSIHPDETGTIQVQG